MNRPATSRLFCYGLLLVSWVFYTGCGSEPQGWLRLDAPPLQFSTTDTRWRVVNYWAEWCKPCLEEIPELNQLAADADAKVIVLGVNYDGLQGDALRTARQQFGIEFDLLLQDPGAELGIVRPTAIPATLLIAPNGQVAAQLMGPQTKTGLLEKIAQLQARRLQSP